MQFPNIVKPCDSDSAGQNSPLFGLRPASSSRWPCVVAPKNMCSLGGIASIALILCTWTAQVFAQGSDVSAVTDRSPNNSVTRDANTSSPNDVFDEHVFKAAALFSFGRFITWPDLATSDNFRVGVLGSNRIMAQLMAIQKRGGAIEDTNGRKIFLELIAFSNEQEVESCHVLFIGENVPAEVSTRIVARLNETSTLVVSETPNFIDFGGTAEFVRVGARVRFSFNLAAAKIKNLVFNASLLQLAYRIIDKTAAPHPPTAVLDRP